MAFNEKRNQNLMQVIKRMHGLVENPDLEKHRQSQDYIGSILGNSKEVTYTEVDMDGVRGEWVSVNRPHMRKYVILYCHGGGYSTGSCLYGRTITSKLATAASIDVLGLDYRLAPEHPCPAALDAMRTALEDAWGNPSALYRPGQQARKLVAGDSAGGNLALVLTLKLKAERRFLPRGLVLMSPWTDLTASGRSYRTKAEVDPVLDAEYIDRMTKAYIPEGENLENPLISPLFGDFEGFPPVYIQVGENEILLSDSVELHKKLQKAGVPAKLDRFKGMWHVFQMSPFRTAADAMEKSAEFICDICR